MVTLFPVQVVSTNFVQYQLMRLGIQECDDNKFADTFVFSKAACSKTNYDSISANKYVACYYDSNWWVRLMQNVIQMRRIFK